MPFETVKAPDMTPQISAPIRASISLRRHKPMLWLSLSEAGQGELFGCSLDGCKLEIKVGSGTESGQLQITIAASGKHTARPSIKNSVRIPVGWWDTLPKTKFKPRPCLVIRRSVENMVCIVALPDWGA